MEGKEASTQEEEKETSVQEEELCKAAREGDCRKVKELIDSGADVTYFDLDGFTPLMYAAKEGHSEVVECLLNSGAPWNALHPSGSCAGDFAMEAAHQDTFDILLNAGLQAELVLGRIAIHEKSNCSADYLEQRVLYSEDRLMDEEGKGVMMAWEKPLMEAHARVVCGGGEGGHILNVGFGMGLVDTAIQKYRPASHTIIEAHPDVYARMQATGWGDKHNVKIIFGRWQDVLPQLESYDGIFFDTYGEYYEDMKEFHQYLPKLLKGEGIYSFFNGLCADNAFFHVVYCQLVALELANLGYTTQFISLPVKDCLEEKAWEGIRRKYWQLDTYYLPAKVSILVFMSVVILVVMSSEDSETKNPVEKIVEKKEADGQQSVECMKGTVACTWDKLKSFSNSAFQKIPSGKKTGEVLKDSVTKSYETGTKSAADTGEKIKKSLGPEEL